MNGSGSLTASLHSAMMVVVKEHDDNQISMLKVRDIIEIRAEAAPWERDTLVASGEEQLMTQDRESMEDSSAASTQPL